MEVLGPVVGLAVAGLVAVVDWVAVATGRPRLESVAKPAVMVVAIAVAVAGIDDGPVRALAVAALTLGLVGDLLLLPASDRFVAGLGAFLLGHGAYVAAFVVVGLGPAATVAGVVVAAALFAVVGRPIAGAVSGRLRLPVTAYVGVIGAMVATALGSGLVVVAIGAGLFAASDALLGWDRFVAPRADRRVFVHILYHLGQLVIVAGLVAAV